jgi:ribonuclease H2 subunit A
LVLQVLKIDTDSKTLTAEQRSDLFNTIINEAGWLGWAVNSLSPQDISEGMLRKFGCYLYRFKYNLNAMAHDATIQLIQAVLAQGVNVSTAYIDTVGPPEKYQEKLQALFPSISITVRKKADSLFPIVRFYKSYQVRLAFAQKLLGTKLSRIGNS